MKTRNVEELQNKARVGSRGNIRYQDNTNVRTPLTRYNTRKCPFRVVQKRHDLDLFVSSALWEYSFCSGRSSESVGCKSSGSSILIANTRLGLDNRRRVLQDEASMAQKERREWWQQKLGLPSHEYLRVNISYQAEKLPLTIDGKSFVMMAALKTCQRGQSHL
jgi:hypothetical protein